MNPVNAAPLLYLASASPRRRELLAQLGIGHVVLSVEVDESSLPGESPEEYVARLALAKARAGWQKLAPAERLPVLGADTSVVLETDILGKPRDERHGLDMLNRLSGRTHRVLSGVALIDERAERVAVSETWVTFRTLSPAEQLAYWRTGEPRDKAGGYAVQGMAASFIARLEGSYSGVMGLPLFETAQLLRDAGIAILDECA